MRSLDMVAGTVSGETHEGYIARLYDESKADHGGNATARFILGSIVLFFWTHTKFFSLAAGFYFFTGMFAAALLSIPTWLLKLTIARRIAFQQALTLRYIWRNVERVYDFGTTWVLFSIARHLFLR